MQKHWVADIDIAVYKLWRDELASLCIEGLDGPWLSCTDGLLSDRLYKIETYEKSCRYNHSCNHTAHIQFATYICIVRVQSPV